MIENKPLKNSETERSLSNISELIHSAKQGNDSARQLIIKNHQRFVNAVIRQYLQKGFMDRTNTSASSLCFTYDELIAAGNIGLSMAIDNYDPSRGFRFVSYAMWWIRQSILTSIAQQK